MQTEAKKIMDNLIRLAELLEGESLQNAGGIRFIDLARAVSHDRRKSRRRTERAPSHKRV